MAFSAGFVQKQGGANSQVVAVSGWSRVRSWSGRGWPCGGSATVTRFVVSSDFFPATSVLALEFGARFGFVEVRNNVLTSGFQLVLP